MVDPQIAGDFKKYCLEYRLTIERMSSQPLRFVTDNFQRENGLNHSEMLAIELEAQRHWRLRDLIRIIQETVSPNRSRNQY